MMGLLNPALLLLGLAIAVPLVLHLFQRQHGPRVVFPALRYLRRAEMENARRIKLRQLLLLALRLAALVLIALAAARPFVRAVGDGHLPTAAVIILDNSMSTGLVDGERRVFDALQARALEALAQAGPDDRFWLIRAAQPWEPAVPGGAEATARLVQETRISAGSADLGGAIARARTLLEGGAEGRAREIHLLTDLQASALESLPAAGPDDPPLLVWAPRPAAVENRAIAAVAVGGGLAPREGERSTVSARIVGVPEDDTVQVRLALDNRVAAAASVAGGSAAVLPFPPRPIGFHAGWVELDPDALRGDDRRYFVAQVLPPPTVALTERVPFVDEALEVLADAGRIRRGGAADAEIVVAPGAAGVGAVRAGRTVIILPPATALELPGANRRLAAAGVPWSFVPAVAAGEARLDVEGVDDELLGGLADARIREVYTLDRQGRVAGDSVLLRLRDGSPWLVRGSLPDGGRYLLIGSPLSEEASTVPTSSAMLPLLDRMIGSWAAAEQPRTEHVPGEYIPLADEATAVERPDGTLDEVVPGSPYRAPSEPGVYRVLSGDRTISAFAVNPPASESQLERLEGSRLRAALGEWQATVVTDPDAWATTVYHERLGRETWRPLVLLVLALLLIEALIAAGSARSASSGGSRGGAPARAAEQRGAGTWPSVAATSGTTMRATFGRNDAKFATGTGANEPEPRTS